MRDAMMKCRPMIISGVLVFAVVAISACAKSNEPIAAPVQPDPRFASAEALLEYYNSLTTREPVDMIAVYNACYAENDVQRQYIDASRQLQPFAELDRLMFQKFGECFNPKSKSHMLAPDKPAKMIKLEGQRAEAELINSDGETQTLRLVQIGDRWWVSGYTFEYLPD